MPSTSDDQNYKSWSHGKIISPEALPTKVAELRGQQETIATLNGSFDLLHAGHLHILFEASKCADVLIVALNTDRSIQRYKSLHRPIVSLEHRLAMMAAIAFVSYVTWFDEDDPRQLLEVIRPDVHVNGAEYGSNCLEGDTIIAHGGRLHIVELVPGLSTSQILEKVRCV